MPTTPRFLPYIALAVGIVALAFSALFVRWADAPGPVTAFFRMSIAVLVMAPLFWHKHRRLRIRPALLIWPLVGGIFTALDHGFWSTAVFYTKVANVTLLGNTTPLWVALFAWLVWREKLTKSFWAGLVMLLIGAAVVLGIDFLLEPSVGLGDLMALAAGLFYAGYLLVTQRGRQHLDVVSYNWLMTGSCALALLGFNLAAGNPLSGFSTHTYLVFLGAALISQVIGYLTVTYALGHLPASTVAPTIIIQPVLTALLAIPLLQETPHLAQIPGIILVLAGVFLVHRQQIPFTKAVKEINA